MGKKSKDMSKIECIAYRFVGYPSEEAAASLRSFIGACRFLWNRMKAESDAYYQEHHERLDKGYAAYKKEEGLEWMKQIDSIALANVQRHYESAMSSFFKDGFGFPKFKKKGVCKDSYTTTVSCAKTPNLRLDDNMLTLPKVKQPIRLKLHRKVRKDGRLASCTITHEKSGEWFFSLLYEYPKTEKQVLSPTDKNFTHIGLDMSLPKLYVDSNGESPDFESQYRNLENKLAKEQRKLSRMKKKSKNYQTQKLRIAKLHSKIKNRRQNSLHCISKKLSDNYNLISIEDLNMRAMSQCLSFGKTVYDNGWGGFTHMLEYKQARRGHYLIKIDKWFPSSKTCSHCGHKIDELKLSDRVYICPVCGNTMDRDTNAGVNIDREGLRQLFANLETAQSA